MDQRCEPAAAVKVTPADQAFADAMIAFDTFHTELGRRGMPWPRRQYQEHPHWRSFLRIGELCQTHGWDPVNYVTSSLELVAKRHTYITASDLMKPQIVANFERFYRERCILSDPAAEWNYLQRQLLSWMTGTEVTETQVLLSPVTPFTCWFRAVYPEIPDPDIIRIYGDDARKELQNNPALRQLLRRVAAPAFAALERLWGAFNEGDPLS